jgi:hypothetical protein
MTFTWTAPEWFDPRDEDGPYLEAYTAMDPEGFTVADVTLDAEDGTWFWIVQATSRLSQYPEVQDAGPAESRADGEAKAEAAVAKAIAGAVPQIY